MSIAELATPIVIIQNLNLSGHFIVPLLLFSEFIWISLTNNRCSYALNAWHIVLLVPICALTLITIRVCDCPDLCFIYLFGINFIFTNKIVVCRCRTCLVDHPTTLERLLSFEAELTVLDWLEDPYLSLSINFLRWIA